MMWKRGACLVGCVLWIGGNLGCSTTYEDRHPPCVVVDVDGDGYYQHFASDENREPLTEKCQIPSFLDNHGFNGKDGALPTRLWDCNDEDASVHPEAKASCDLSIDNDCDPSTPADDDGDGFYFGGACNDDCNDSDGSIHPDAEEHCNNVDDDCNGLVDDNDEDQDSDGSPSCLDCDDLNDARAPSRPELCDGLDNDCDGIVPPGERDVDADGIAACAGDCNDYDAEIYPGRPNERCNGLDDDCIDGVPVNELDVDGDGVLACMGDCDDSEPRSTPGRIEVCDGIDNNCDGTVDEGSDGDGDGWGACVDCNDNDASLSPSTPETCNGVDDNCDGIVPSAEQDMDGDGVIACLDCDDTRADVYPGAPEVCDGVDNDCDTLDDNVLDADGDGFVCDADCMEGDPDMYPGAPERCNGVDDDCDGITPSNELDEDGDRYAACEGDCDDTQLAVFPGAVEVCDGLDNDCDDDVDGPYDNDGDGYVTCGVALDCDDEDPAVHPGAPELCNGADDNCDGVRLLAEMDVDGDRAFACPGPDQDCDDRDPRRSPFLIEDCDGVDNDCDGQLGADELDEDLDGRSTCQGDCDDGDPTLNVFDLDGDGQSSCDGDCDDFNPTVLRIDGDNDGAFQCVDDCDDTNPAVSPSAPELCNELDDNCNGAVDEIYPDVNGDRIADCIELCDNIDNNGDGSVDEGFTRGPDKGTWVDPSVSPGGVGTVVRPMTTIAAAIDRSLTDTPCPIMLVPGTHTAPAVLPAHPIEIRGSAGPAVTFLEAVESSPILTFEPGATRDTVVSNVTFRNGVATFDAAYGGSFGGAVVVDGASPTFSCVRFDGNEAADGGGAVAVFEGGPRFEDTVFVGNTAQGAGIDDGGGGLWIWGSGDQPVELDRVAFVDNSTPGSGGGLAIQDGADVRLTASVVFQNSANEWGGGVWVEESTLHMSGVWVQGNLGTNGGGMGSGSRLGTVMVEHATFVENEATSGFGGGLWFLGDQTSVFDTIFAYNGIGGDIGFGADDGLQQPAPALSHLLFYGSTTMFSNFGPPITGIVGTSGIISSNPLFASFDADGSLYDDDISLLAASPARDAGRDDSEFNDADGTRSDMGATGGPTPWQGIDSCVWGQ